ncbi:hypothetical protein BJ322DRAFT_603409 [Thelephora terrestris]|uniref:Uncharacterized protein n=1 Tax=Thelephora terrestris TaxID=56493 RepID=A0A9P6HIJ3_9AGAM|nr:hypothetical protein BJ322DRAFT_603409 [Thelephora terrestris]
MLSSFINRRKVKKTRTPSEDQENPRYKLGNSYSKNHASVVIGLRPPALHRQSSPKVYLDFTPSGSNDWFPPEILAPPDEDSHLPIQPVPESSTSHSYDDVVVIGHAAHPFKPHPSPALPPLPVHDGPSPFEPRHDATTPPLSRKPAPAPIKIPSHPSKVQIQYTASANYSGLKESSALLPPTAHEPSNSFQPGTTHPSSAISPNDGSSAISGTTLARALIANSFILSNDGHSRNRYRSGCHLVRQDSATLPSANDKGLVVSPDTYQPVLCCISLPSFVGGNSPETPIQKSISPDIPAIPPTIKEFRASAFPGERGCWSVR